MHPLGTRELEPSGRLGGSGLLTNTIGNPLETTIALSHLIFEGTLDRFPGLKICAAHGGGFLPSYANRSDAVCRTFPGRVGPLPKKNPTAYLRDGQLYFDTIVFTPEALRHLIAETGPDQIMMGTDYPFPWTSTEVDLILQTPGSDRRSADRHPGRNRGTPARHCFLKNVRQPGLVALKRERCASSLDGHATSQPACPYAEFTLTSPQSPAARGGLEPLGT